MEYTKLGDSGISVSKLCVGYMDLNNSAGRALDFDENEEMIKTALALGINFFDATNCDSNERSEQRLGAVLKKNIARDKVVIATTLSWSDDPAIDLSRAVDESLKRLDTDYVDLLMIPCSSCPSEETMESLNGVVKAGKVRALGALATFKQFINMQNTAKSNSWTPFVSIQNDYHLFCREDEHILSVCKERNIAITPHFPLVGYDSSRESDRKIAERVHKLARRHGASMTQIILAWLFSKGISSPIIGATKPQQLVDAAGCFYVDLTTQETEYLEELYVPQRNVGAV